MRDSKHETNSKQTWNTEEPLEKECGWPLGEKVAPQRPARKREPQTYGHQELDSANILNALEHG